MGFEITREDDLVVPYVLRNADEQRDFFARQALFEWPLAVAGWMVGGPVGGVLGVVVGSVAGYARGERVKKP